MLKKEKINPRELFAAQSKCLRKYIWSSCLRVDRTITERCFMKEAMRSILPMSAAGWILNTGTLEIIPLLKALRSVLKILYLKKNGFHQLSGWTKVPQRSLCIFQG